MLGGGGGAALWSISIFMSSNDSWSKPFSLFGTLNIFTLNYILLGVFCKSR